MVGHGERKDYLLVNDDDGQGGRLERFYRDTSLSGMQSLRSEISAEAMMKPEAARADAQSAFRFGWMFPDINAPIIDEQDEAAKKAQAVLIKLGQLMNKQPPSPAANSGGGVADDSDIPSGYTYFGQFIAHEITFDGIPLVPGITIHDLQTVPQKRSPSIDCDSLYGAGPVANPDLYDEENQSNGIRVRLKLGETVQTASWGGKLLRDLPRPQGETTSHLAFIGDPRNDENLVLAQMHVAFIVFHNKIVDELAGQYAGQELFDKACEQVIRHLQWIVLTDYLPRIIEEEVLKRVVEYVRANKGELEFFKFATEADMFMPVEFSVAAFRLGHSMIRQSYEWNFFHKTKTDTNPSANFSPATLLDFFVFTGLCGTLGGNNNLPGEWIVDWRRFFDFTEVGEKNPPALTLNRAKRIDTKFDFHLDELVGYPFNEEQKEWRPITVRNLRRGFALRLPTGQAIAKKILPAPEEGLTPEQIADSSDLEITQLLNKSGLDRNTPLWYYILKEAEVFHQGQKLGPVGSRIVAETFVGIIWNSKHSILKNDGPPIPAFGARQAEGKFGMADMLKFTGNMFGKDEPSE
jgi:hypothetical protein